MDWHYSTLYYSPHVLPYKLWECCILSHNTRGFLSTDDQYFKFWRSTKVEFYVCILCTLFGFAFMPFYWL